MKYTESRPYADPEKAARRIVEIASTVEPAQDGCIHVELINGPFLFKDKGSPAEYGAGMALAIERGWLTMHESGTYVRFTPAGADLFACWPCHGSKRAIRVEPSQSSTGLSSTLECEAVHTGQAFLVHPERRSGLRR